MSASCPECGNSFRPEKKTINGVKVLVFKCCNGHFVNITNDLSELEKKIDLIMKKLDINPS